MSDFAIPRGECEVGEKSLHYRVYKWRYKHTSKSPPPIEDLCRYMRTVLIWAPLVWFFVAPVKWGVRPWMMVVGLLSLLFTGYAFYLWPAESLEILVKLLIVVACIVVFAFIVGLISHYSDRAKTVFMWVSFPVWGPIIALIVAALWMWDVFLERFVRWFTHTRYRGHWWLRPWVSFAVVLIASLIVTSSVQWGARETFFAIAFGFLLVFAAVAVVAVFYALFVLGENHAERVIEREQRNWSSSYDTEEATSSESEPKGPGLIRMIWNFLRAKKAKICPFIILPDGKDRHSASSLKS